MIGFYEKVLAVYVWRTVNNTHNCQQQKFFSKLTTWKDFWKSVTKKGRHVKAKCRTNLTAYLVPRGLFIRLRWRPMPNVQVFKFLGGNLDWQVVRSTFFCNHNHISHKFHINSFGFQTILFYQPSSHASVMLATWLRHPQFTLTVLK